MQKDSLQSFHMKNTLFTSIIISIALSLLMTFDLLVTYRHAYNKEKQQILRTIEQNISLQGKTAHNKNAGLLSKQYLKNIIANIAYAKAELFINNNLKDPPAAGFNNSPKANYVLYNDSQPATDAESSICIIKSFKLQGKDNTIKTYVMKSQIWSNIAWQLDKTVIFYCMIAILTIIIVNLSFYLFATKEIKYIADTTSKSILNPNYDLQNLFFINSQDDVAVIKENFNFLIVKLRTQRESERKKEQLKTSKNLKKQKQLEESINPA